MKFAVLFFTVAIDWLLCMGPGVSGVDSDACRDIDAQACGLMAQKNPGLCQDPVLSRTACPKFCKMCPLECYHCEVSVRDYMDCNTTTACDVNQRCMLQKMHSSQDGHDEYVMGCASLQLCDVGGLTLAFGRRALHERNVEITCCDADRCNLPTESGTVAKPTESSTVSTPTQTSTVSNTITHKPTHHLPSCVRDIVLIIEDFGEKTSNMTMNVDPSTHYMTTFLKELVARLPIGPTDSLLELALMDSDIHSIWSLMDHPTNDSLQMAINGIPFQHRKDRIDIENLVDFLSKEAFDIMSGERPSVPNAVVIFVDHRGRPDTHHGHVSGLGSDSRHDVQQASGDVIIVNIGSPDLSDVHQMSVLATDAHHVLLVSDYDALHGIKDTLVNLICN